MGGRVLVALLLCALLAGCMFRQQEPCAPQGGVVPPGCDEVAPGKDDFSALVDPSPDEGRIYVASMVQHKIARLDDMAGKGLAFFGTWGSGTGQFDNPWHIRPDSTGRIIVTEREGGRLIRFDAFGTVTGWTTLPTDSPLPGSGHTPMGLEGPDGRIYFTRGDLFRVDDFSGSGLQTLGVPAGERLQNPKGVAFDRSGGMYVVDSENHRIVHVDDFSGAGWTTFGTFGAAERQFHRPEAVALDSKGRIYVTDNENDRIVRMDDMSGANWIAFAERPGAPPHGDGGRNMNRLFNPHDVAISSTDRIYIADTGNAQIVRIDDMTGSGWIAYGYHGAGSTDFEAPKGLFVR